MAGPPLGDFTAVTPDTFAAAALKVFYYQAKAVPVYRKFLQLLDIRPEEISSWERIPFLPVELFKTHSVIAEGFTPALVFESSGTTGSVPSRLPVAQPSLYRQSILNGFHKFYGNPKDYCILALLPSYLERSNASLLYMCNYLMESSGHPDNGFYLYDHEKLAKTLRYNELKQIQTLLIGVSFALLDFAERYPMPLRHTTIMETGGMKGRRKEITRNALHDVLKQAFQLSTIHSEYGMTELLSQGYSRGDGIFLCPPWMRILVRDTTDPFSMLGINKNGLLNVIDLANQYACSFIATQDSVILYTHDTFGVTGRMDTAAVRGCNLMAI